VGGFIYLSGPTTSSYVRCFDEIARIQFVTPNLAAPSSGISRTIIVAARLPGVVYVYVCVCVGGGEGGVISRSTCGMVSEELSLDYLARVRHESAERCIPPLEVFSFADFQRYVAENFENYFLFGVNMFTSIAYKKNRFRVNYRTIRVIGWLFAKRRLKETPVSVDR